jgi:two-component system alkaline phosphatase synthesis response regulator PhoP
MNSEKQKDTAILLVEDEESMAIGLQYNLREEGYNVDWVTDGRQALDRFQAQSYDLVILDIMLPYIDGFQVAEKIRASDVQLPILILTARTGIQDRIKGLEAGADDYLTKPFHLEELMLRVKRMLRRKLWYQNATSINPIYTIGNTEINFENFVCRRQKDTFSLTIREAMVLKYLIEHKGQIVSRQDLLENVWGISSEVETRTVDIFISRLRKYLESDPAKPVFIKSIRGAGYMFED